MAADVASYPTERELTRSEEEERLLREIREEKERLWVEISVRECARAAGAVEMEVYISFVVGTKEANY